MSNSSFISQTVPRTMKAGATYSILVSMQNTGTDTWISTGSTPYSLGDVPHDTFIFGINRTPLPNMSPVPPNAYATFSFNVTAPSTPGNYTMQWQMVQDGVAWFGAVSTALTITVTPSRINARALNSGKFQVLTTASEGVYFTERTQADFAAGTLTGVASTQTQIASSTAPKQVNWRARFWQAQPANHSNLINANFAPILAQTPTYETQFPTIALNNYAVPGGTSYDTGAGSNNSGASTFMLGRFDGHIVPAYTEPYTFVVGVDDYVAIFLNGGLGYSVLTASSVTWVSPVLTAGQQYDISVVWFNYGGPGSIQVQWKSPSQAQQYIPCQVYPVLSYPGTLAVTGTNTSGTRVSPPIAIGSLGAVGANATLSVTGTTPTTSTIAVSTSIDGGNTYQALGTIAAGNSNYTLAGNISGLPAGAALSASQSLQVKTAFTSDGINQPSVSRSSVRIDALRVSFHNDGSLFTSELQELQPYRQAVMADSPVMYWRMHDRVNTPYVCDSSGNGNTGSLPNPSWTTFGGSDAITEPGGTSLFVNQAASGVSVQGNIASPPQNVGAGTGFTFECWVMVPSQTITVDTPGFSGGNLYAGTTSGAQMYCWMPSQYASSGGAGLSVGTNAVQVFELASGYMPCLASYTYPSANTGWTHIAVVYNNQTPTIYVNGVAVTTGIQSQKSTSVCPFSLGNLYGANPVYSIAECATYATSLSSTRIAAHYQAGVTALGTKFSFQGGANAVKLLVPAYLEENSVFA